MPTFRHREEVISHHGIEGWKQYYSNGIPFGSKTYSPSSPTAQRECDDYLSSPPYPDHNLLMELRRCKASMVSGEYPISSTLKEVFSSYTTDRMSNYAFAPAPSVWNWDDYLETLAIKSLSPTRPIVDLPLFLFEFREFPRMLKDLGRVLQKKVKPADVPGGFLSYQFGWAPLVSDLRKLGNLVELMEKEARFHRELRNGKKVKRTVYRDTTHSFPGTTGFGISGVNLMRHITREHKGWFTARVSLKDTYPFEPESQGLSALRRALGLSVSAATIWNMVPWTWLIDYFVNIGDVLEASRGVFPYRLTDMNLMYKEVATERLHVLTTKPGLEFDLGYWETHVKRRAVVASPRLKFALKPALDGRKIAIISALAMAKLLKRA